MLALLSCEGLYIPDPIDPRLPKYTENGNDVAGAFVNKDCWTTVERFGFQTTSYKPYIITSAITDSLVIQFSGKMSYEYATIEFHLKGLNIRKFDDLILLKNKKIQLDGVMNFGVVTDSYLGFSPNASGMEGVGQIYFRNVTFNNSLGIVILSGTFGFTETDSSSPITDVSYGRFDYSLSENSNFRIE
jgi:hypothetical protein